jgi:predicted DNA-binding ribbon-helix-helix protein
LAGILLPAQYRISYFVTDTMRGLTIMKSSIVKRSIVIDGHKTSVSLEDAFWTTLKDIAHAESVAVSKIVADIDKKRKLGNLSSAIRLYVLDRARVGEQST